MIGFALLLLAGASAESDAWQFSPDEIGWTYCSLESGSVKYESPIFAGRGRDEQRYQADFKAFVLAHHPETSAGVASEALCGPGFVSQSPARELKTRLQSEAGASIRFIEIDWKPAGAPAREPARPLKEAPRPADGAAQVVTTPAPSRVGDSASGEVSNANQSQAGAASDQVTKYRTELIEFRAASDAAEKQRREYEQEMLRYRARVLESERAQQEWKADVAACKAGNTSKCAPRQ